MIQANELRIGNWVNIPVFCGNYKVLGILKSGEIQFKRKDFDCVDQAHIYEPIPLTEEILLKCFEYDSIDDQFRFSVGGCKYVIEEQDGWYFIGVDNIKNKTYFIWDILFVHHLQNICSSLICELNIEL